MSLGEFQGPSSSGGRGTSRPTGPRARGPDDDGSFQRYPKQHGEREPREHSRSEQDSSWRRGGGGGAVEDNHHAAGRGGGGGFRSSERNSYNNNNNERGSGSGEERTGSWRGGNDRPSRDDRGSNSDRPSREDRGRSWRGGGGDSAPRSGGTETASSSTGGERPRLQLRQKGGGPPSDNVTAQMEKLEVHENNNHDSAATANDASAPAVTSRPKREPDVVNSRAAGLSGGDSSYRREVRLETAENALFHSAVCVLESIF